MLEMAEWVQKSRHYLRLHFPEPRCHFPSSVTFDLSLEDLIEGFGDTSWVLVEGWEGGASGRVKSQLPSLGLGHVWGTTYVSSSLWKHAVASLSTTCMKSNPDRFHPLSYLASPGTSLVSLGEYFLKILATLGLHCCSGLLYLQGGGATLIAVHWLFNPVLLLMEITGSRALRLSSYGPLASRPGAFAIFSLLFIYLHFDSIYIVVVFVKHWHKSCIPHPDAPSHLPLHPIPLGLPSAPGPSTCLMYPAWAGDLFHPRWYTCFDVVLWKHPTPAFFHRVQKSVLYICVSFSVLHIGLLLPSF